MATDKATVKKKLKAGFQPLFNSLVDASPADLPNDLLDNTQPLQITVIFKKEGVQVQETRQRGRNAQGVCGWFFPKDIVSDC